MALAKEMKEKMIIENMTNEEVRNFVYGCTRQEAELLVENLGEATINGISYLKAENDLYHAEKILQYHSETLEKFCPKEIIDRIRAERDKMHNIVKAFEFGEKYIRLCHTYYHISDVKPHIEKVIKNRNIESVFKNAIEYVHEQDYGIQEFSDYMKSNGYTVTIEPTYVSETD